MFAISIASGILSSMYLWSDKFSHVGISINDVYMTGIMTGWMFFFMAFLDKKMDDSYG
jgi:hypothetical protein